MKDMNKQFEYKGYKFNIKVEFNTKMFNDIHLHTITINDMGLGNYYEKKQIQDELLVECIKMMETRAKSHVDKRPDTNPVQDQRLLDLGFK